jgi:hypothetical protein
MQLSFFFYNGAASQYKNRRNFINFCYHKDDFDVDIEWHFFAPSHSKGACDGIGQTMKASKKSKAAKEWPVV